LLPTSHLRAMTDAEDYRTVIQKGHRPLGFYGMI